MTLFGFALGWATSALMRRIDARRQRIGRAP